MNHLLLPSTMLQQKILKKLTNCIKHWNKKGDAMEIGEEKYMLREQPKTLQHSFNEERGKAYKGAKTIPLNYKKQQEKQQTIQLIYAQIFSIKTQANHKVMNQSKFPNSKKKLFRV